MKIPQEIRQKIFDYVHMQLDDVWQSAESFSLMNIEGKADSISLKIDELLEKLSQIYAFPY